MSTDERYDAVVSKPGPEHLKPSEPGQGSQTSGASSGDERNSPAPDRDPGGSGLLTDGRDDIETIRAFISRWTAQWVELDELEAALAALSRLQQAREDDRHEIVELRSDVGSLTADRASLSQALQEAEEDRDGSAFLKECAEAALRKTEASLVAVRVALREIAEMERPWAGGMRSIAAAALAALPPEETKE